MSGPRKPSETCLTVRELLQFAIQSEVEAAKGYGDMALKTKTPGLRTMLLELQSEEQNHKKLLEGLAAGDVVPLPAGEIEDLRISDYLVEQPLDETSSLQDLLIFAAKKEAKAVALYTRLLGQCSLPQQKRLFEFLIQQEQSHKLKLEKEYEATILKED